MRWEDVSILIPKKINLSPVQVIAMGFAAIIVLGGLLLMLPIANRNGHSIPFLNALFTATSATCVTGLVVYDTWTQFTGFGQAVILLLIQIGGLGFMNVTTFFFFVMRKRIGLWERELLTESVNAMHIGGIVKLTRRILFGTLAFESCGALLLMTRFIPAFGASKGIWYGVFHAVSAFCNAGFDLLGCIEPYSSLMHFAGDPVVNLTIMGLIIIGGIGFIVWSDIADKGFHFKKYALHTKVMLITTAGLIVVGALLLLWTERNGVFADMPWPEKILAALFQAVTPRTAGFNTVDNAALSDSGTLLTILLMFVGAGPGSTGGGIKVTTAAVVAVTLIGYLKGHESVDISGRRIEADAVRRAFCTMVFYFILAATGALIMIMCQPLPLKDTLFEAFSAFGTVGLSTGITRSLTVIPKLVLILLMYSGRIGSLTVILSISRKRVKATLNPIGKIMIG